jgi:signal transduction histidine kinase
MPSLDAFVPSLRELLDRALPASVRLRIEPAGEIWSCTPDLFQLEAALLNLAINARDAMPDGGALGITFENRHVDSPCASSSGAEEGDFVVVGVSDTGTGMPPEVESRAFEPFFTTKALGKGTGLGLSQVRAFAERSGGFVTIETAMGQGTRVLVFLPRDQ